MRRCGNLVIVALVAVQGICQQNGSPPKDPRDLLTAAAAANGLMGSDLRPWHIRISFKTRNWKGDDVLSSGSFEEFWAGPTRYKRSFVTQTFSQVEYGTAEGIRRTGDPNDPDRELIRIADMFLNPIDIDRAALEKTRLEKKERKIGSASLSCIDGSDNLDSTMIHHSTYCFSDNSLMLRIIVNRRNLREVRNRILELQGRYLAGDIEEFLNSPPELSNKPILESHVEIAESLQTIPDSVITAPSDAIAAPEVISLNEKQTSSKLLTHPNPIYPPIARAAHVFGAVVLSLEIRTDGRVSNVQVISGHPMLQQAALNAVRQWTYKPFIENGRPVEAKTQVAISFHGTPF